ncbi:hypothetical protein BGZ72_001441, partial [Mortierella alpina]
MLTDSPSFGRQMILDVASYHTKSPTPHSLFLCPAASHLTKMTNYFSVVQNVLVACQLLPAVSLSPRSPGALLPPFQLLLETPVTWWLNAPAGTPPRASSLNSPLWMTDVFTFDDKTRLLVPRPLDTLTAKSQEVQVLWKRIKQDKVFFKPEIGWATDSPSFECSSRDGRTALSTLPIPAPQTTTLLQASKTQLRAVLHPHAEARFQFTKAQWTAFWKARINKAARN